MSLEIIDIECNYGSVRVIKKISFTVKSGDFICIFGPNGHGKSTLLKAISGAHPLAGGKILYNGKDISKLPTHKVVQEGIVYVPEEGHLFTEMSVLENLNLGAYNKTAEKRKAENLEFVYELFPRLEERKNQKCGTLSGGERRMVAIGRGLMASPKLLMLDEPSFGLAPKMVKATFDAAVKISKTANISIIIVEQEIKSLMNLADWAYVLKKGKIVLEGDRHSLDYEMVKKVYF